MIELHGYATILMTREAGVAYKSIKCEVYVF